MYALKSSSSSPAYVLALGISYFRPDQASWVGDLSFVQLVLRILSRQQTHVSLIWHIHALTMTSGSPLSLRRQSLDIYWQIYKQCGLARQLWQHRTP